MDIQNIEEIWQGKVRAKDYEIEELRIQLEDREAIADGRVADARAKLNRAEKSIA